MRPRIPWSLARALPRLAATVASVALVASLAPLPASAQPVRPYRPAVDVLDYEFAVSIPDSGAAIDARATVRFVRAAPTDTRFPCSRCSRCCIARSRSSPPMKPLNYWRIVRSRNCRMNSARFR